MMPPEDALTNSNTSRDGTSLGRARSILWGGRAISFILELAGLGLYHYRYLQWA